MHNRGFLTLVLVAVFGISASLFAQGLTTTAQKDDWEEINFVFDSTILTDGYPSLLRLGELLSQNPAYKVKVEGHTDSRGTDRYNDKLAAARAETVKNFLLKYGARPGQVETVSRGKRDPKVDNKTNEGRFMNRRVVLTLSEAQGKVVSSGGVGDCIKALNELAKAQKTCCEDILKKLDKLDDILAMLKDLKGENDRLKQDMDALKQAQAGVQQAQQQVQQQVAQLPKPPEREELAKMLEATAQKAIEENRPKRFQLLGVNLGADTTGNLVVTGKARYFSPFGETHALQAEAEYMRYRDRQEGQFDIGLVNRYKNFQAGLFSSFKRVELKDYHGGGTLGQAAVGLDYLFSRGRIGMFATKAFLDSPVIRRVAISRNVFDETYLKVVDQFGGSTQIGLYKNSYIEGNLGAMFRQGGSNRPGGMVRFVQPVNSHWAFTVEGGLNETLIGQNNSGRVAVGLQLGNWIRPKDFVALKHPVPMDVPRIRYEILTRRVRTGNDPPVADAGPDQIGANAGTITLDGSGSYDPDGDPITYLWEQISGSAVSITGANMVQATFTAAAGQSYSFRLTVKDDKNAMSRARVTITTAAAPQVKIVRFSANPTSIQAGQTTTVVWQVLDADTVTISGIGSVDPKAGTSTVTLSQTTMFTLTAKNKTSEVNETLTVVVQRPDARILSFMATPATIASGQVSTLSWQTENATSVTISGIGAVQATASTTVSPTATTTYTLTASNQFGQVSSTATVQVTPGSPGPAAQAPRILRFAATPTEILPSEQASLVWQVENATDVSITGIGAVDPTGTSTVSPADTTTYTITAKNSNGQVSATATVTVDKLVKILNFVANPSQVAHAGDAATLQWQTENATSAVITGVGSVPVNGSIVVHPSSDVSYTLIAYGRRSQVVALVILRVGATGGGTTSPAGNHPPVANAGPNQPHAGPDITLDGTGSSDPDGDPITCSWRVVAPPAAWIYNPNSCTTGANLSSGIGEYIFELTVFDTSRATSSAFTTVTYVGP